MDSLVGYDSDSEIPTNESTISNNNNNDNNNTNNRLLFNSAPDVQIDDTNTQLISHNNTLPLNKPQSKTNHYRGSIEQIAYDTASFNLQYNNKIIVNNDDNNNNNKRPIKKHKTNDVWALPDHIVEQQNIDNKQNNNKNNNNNETTTPQQNVFTEITELHISSLYDYMKRSYITIPPVLQIPSRTPQCYIPKHDIHTYTGHAREVNKIRFFPRSGHLLFSISNDSSIRIWSTVNKNVLQTQDQNKQCIRSIYGHTQGIRDIQLTYDGLQFCTASYDRYVKIFDTETGQCLNRIRQEQGKLPNCVLYPPNNKNGLLVGYNDRRIIQYDLRVSNKNDVIQTYSDHQAQINSMLFIDDVHFMSVSDDKRLYQYEYGINVVVKQINEMDMHSLTNLAVDPVNRNTIIAQSQDNTIRTFSVQNMKIKLNRKKVLTGHISAGYSCGLCYSPDGQYICSGDGTGKLVIWDSKTNRIVKKLNAHQQVCIDVQWHPYETSKIATCSWDGTIKYWD